MGKRHVELRAEFYSSMFGYQSWWSVVRMQNLNTRGSTSHPVNTRLVYSHIQYIFTHQGLFSTPSGALLHMAVKSSNTNNTHQTLYMKHKKIICGTELYLNMILLYVLTLKSTHSVKTKSTVTIQMCVQYTEILSLYLVSWFRKAGLIYSSNSVWSDPNFTCINIELATKQLSRKKSNGS